MQVYGPLGFDQFVTTPTHVRGHILDVVLSRSPTLVVSVDVEDIQLSDHSLLLVVTDLSRPRVPRKTMSYRNLKAINRQAFCEDLEKSALLQSPPEDVDELVET
jgi:hypothetical protein